MADATPQIKLHVSLVDFQGAQIGSAGSPAFVRIALAGFGQSLPRIAGTALIGQVASWPQNLPYAGTALDIDLWGNDVIVPSGTYYDIAILDSNKNVIQSGAYQFTGNNQTVDLSAATPYAPAPPPAPVVPSVNGGLVVVPCSATPVFDCAQVVGPIAFDITLTEDVTAPTAINAYPGQQVAFFISQDGTGGRAWTWPANVVNAGEIDSTAASCTAQTFMARGDGRLYPLGPSTYN